MIINKCQSKPFSFWSKFVEAGKILDSGRERFEDEDVTAQAINLKEALLVLKTGRTMDCNLKFSGGVKKFNTVRLNSVLNKTVFKNIHIIDQSPTGLFEKKSVNLLEL